MPLQGINYQMIWAMGQMEQNISRSPPGSINSNTAVNRNFYKQDVLMYHGGGVANGSDVASPFRGTLGNVDLFMPSQPLKQGSACAPSTIQVGGGLAGSHPKPLLEDWTEKSVSCMCMPFWFMKQNQPLEQTARQTWKGSGQHNSGPE